MDKQLERLIREFAKDLKESNDKFECRKMFVHRMKDKFKKSRNTIFRYIRFIKKSSDTI